MRSLKAPKHSRAQEKNTFFFSNFLVEVGPRVGLGFRRKVRRRIKELFPLSFPHSFIYVCWSLEWGAWRREQRKA
jgi:hypothetical protein